MTMSEFIKFLSEVFEDFGEITTRKMFGGYGIYHAGLMFALVEDEVLYLKADDTSRHHFESRVLPPFQYTKKAKVIKLSYYLAPEEIYEDRKAAAIWARRAYAAALGAKRNSRNKCIQ